MGWESLIADDFSLYAANQALPNPPWATFYNLAAYPWVADRSVPGIGLTRGVIRDPYSAVYCCVSRTAQVLPNDRQYSSLYHYNMNTWSSYDTLLFLRVQGYGSALQTTPSGYYIRGRRPQYDDRCMQLLRMDAGSQMQIGSDAPITPTTVNPMRFRAEADGSSMLGYLNGVLEMTRTDATYPSGYVSHFAVDNSGDSFYSHFDSGHWVDSSPSFKAAWAAATRQSTILCGGLR